MSASFRSKLLQATCLLALAALAACSGGSERERPRGIGSDRDDMKRSPCACLPLQQKPVTPAELERYRTILQEPT